MVKFALILLDILIKKQFPEGLLFEGVTLENGKPYYSTNEGGSVGNDPSYQIFEAGFGINFPDDLARFEEYFARGFMFPHKKAIKDVKVSS